MLKLSVEYMFQTSLNQLKAQLEKDKVTGKEYDGKIEEFMKKKTQIDNENTAYLTNEELHFTVLILKAKDGKSVSGIIQKQGADVFNPNVVPESKATDGGIKYVPYSRKSDERETPNYFYTERKINN